MRTRAGRAACLIASVLSVPALVACGPSAPASGPAASTAANTAPVASPSGRAEQLLDYARCMRDNGVTDFPDPADDGSLDMSEAGIDMDSSTFKAAHQECENLLPRPVRDPGSGEKSGNAVQPGAGPGSGGAKEGSDPAPGWKQIVPGGDCLCTDGSEFSFWAREADPTKVLLYFDSGGACFSAETCDPAADLYNITANKRAPVAAGVFDPSRSDNPFADYSMIFVPYCSADVFLGNTTTTYGSDLTIHHQGYANGTAALDYLADTFGEATHVVVAGGSAGSVAAPLYGGLVADRLPDAAVTVLADGSGSYPDLARLNTRFTEAWNTDDAIDALTSGATTEWSMPGLFALTGRYHPGVVLARHDQAYDGQQAAWFPRIDLPVGDLLTRMQDNESQIEVSGVILRSYTAPGTDHVVLNSDEFYTQTVGGRSLVDWVADLIDGKPVDDVLCTECGP